MEIYLNANKTDFIPLVPIPVFYDSEVNKFQYKNTIITIFQNFNRSQTKHWQNIKDHKQHNVQYGCLTDKEYNIF